MHGKKSMLCYLLLFLCCNGCKKNLDVGPPADELSADVIFSNDSLARDAITGLYITLMGNNQSLINGAMSIYPALSADELSRPVFRVDDDQFLKNSLTPDNFVLLNFWRVGYAAIYQSNICIQKLSNSSEDVIPDKKQLIGEARFVRALCFWYLVNLFGDVPLVTGTNIDANSSLPRSPSTRIYQLIVADLQSALSLLPDTEVNTRPNKLAATALLARAHCYLNEWDHAETNASSVINAGRHALSIDLSKVFAITSPETILQFAPVLPNNSTAEAFIFIPPINNVTPSFTLSNSLLACFEPGDLRKSWFLNIVVNGHTYSYPYKYKIKSSTTQPLEYNVVFRLSEQYLIRAEAKAHAGKISEAVADLNVVRNRAGLAPVTNGVGLDSCLSAIMQERRKEFFAEWGHRWFDLKRTNTINAEMKISKGDDWQTHDGLYPIPLYEMQMNPSLIQNNGY